MSGSKSSAISTNSNSNSYPQPANRRGIPFRCTYIYHHRTTIIKLIVSTSFYNAKLCREVLFFFLQLLFFNYTTLNYFCFLLIFEKNAKSFVQKFRSKELPPSGTDYWTRAKFENVPSSGGKQKWRYLVRAMYYYFRHGCSVQLFHFKRRRVAIAISAIRWKTFRVNFCV